MKETRHLSNLYLLVLIFYTAKTPKIHKLDYGGSCHLLQLFYSCGVNSVLKFSRYELQDHINSMF